MKAGWWVILCLVTACETHPPPGPDFAGEITFDLGPPPDGPTPYGLDGNFLPVPRPAGTFVFSVTDETGAPIPARVVFRPSPGEGFADDLTMMPTPMMRPQGELTGATVSPGVIGIPEGVLLQNGYGSVSVPPGDYTLVFTRGPEYEIAEVKISIAENVEQAVNVELHRSVDTRNWFAADLHVHSGHSFDSRVPEDRRVVSLVANGIEILVPTEHHGIYDFSEMLGALGYGPDVAVSIAGDELNFNAGHAGVYPLTPQPLRAHGGSPPYQNLDNGVCDEPIIGTNCFPPAEAFALMHQLRRGGTIVTLNHPWFVWSDLGYFTNLPWGAGTVAPFPSPLPIAGTFDALEILNGYLLHPEVISYVFADWLYLIEQGYPVTAVGSSDSHGMQWVYAGSPRTMLRFQTDQPGDVTPDALYDAVKHQRAIATNGPFLTIQVNAGQANSGQIGDTIVGHQAKVRITADSPSWMPLDTIVLFKNGREMQRFQASEFQRPRLDVEVDDELKGDAYYVALATGSIAMPFDVVGEQISLDQEQVLPIAITNPIYVDYDGDGALRFAGHIGSRLPWTPPKPTPSPNGASWTRTGVAPGDVPDRSFGRFGRFGLSEHDQPLLDEVPRSDLSTVMPALYP